MSALYVCVGAAGGGAVPGVCVYVCLVCLCWRCGGWSGTRCLCRSTACMPALYVCLVRLPCMSALYMQRYQGLGRLICLPYMSALYVCLVHAPGVCVAGRQRCRRARVRGGAGEAVRLRQVPQYHVLYYIYAIISTRRRWGSSTASSGTSTIGCGAITP